MRADVRRVDIPSGAATDARELLHVSEVPGISYRGSGTVERAGTDLKCAHFALAVFAFGCGFRGGGFKRLFSRAMVRSSAS